MRGVSLHANIRHFAHKIISRSLPILLKGIYLMKVKTKTNQITLKLAKQ